MLILGFLNLKNYTHFEFLYIRHKKTYNFYKCGKLLEFKKLNLFIKITFRIKNNCIKNLLTILF